MLSQEFFEKYLGGLVHIFSVNFQHHQDTQMKSSGLTEMNSSLGQDYELIDEALFGKTALHKQMGFQAFQPLAEYQPPKHPSHRHL